MALDQRRAETPYGPMLRAVGRVCCWCDAAGSWCWGLASDRIRFSTMQPLARPVSITRDNLSAITLITVGGSVWLHRIEWPAFRLGQAVIYSPWSHTQVKIIFLCLLWFKWQMTMANMVTFIMLPFVFCLFVTPHYWCCILQVKSWSRNPCLLEQASTLPLHASAHSWRQVFV